MAVPNKKTLKSKISPKTKSPKSNKRTTTRKRQSKSKNYNLLVFKITLRPLFLILTALVLLSVGLVLINKLNESNDTTTVNAAVTSTADDSRVIVSAETGYCYINYYKVDNACQNGLRTVSGSDKGRAVVLTRSKDYVSASFNADSVGTYRLGYSMKSISYRGDAKIDLYLDNTRIKSGVNVSSKAIQLYYVTRNLTAGEHKLKVVFINDKCGNSWLPRQKCIAFGRTDRNLVVDQFLATLSNGTPTPNPNPGQTPSPGTNPTPTPTPTPTPNPVPSPTGSIFLRPFPKSAVYQKVPAGEPNHANSSAMVAAIVTTGKNFDRSNGPRRWQGKTSDPIWAFGPGGFKMYAPDNIVGSGGADDTIEIYNEVTPNNGPPRVVRMWGGDSVALKVNRSARTMSGSTFGVADPSSDGRPISGSGTAWGLFSALGVFLYQGDYTEGTVDHAIGAALGNNLLSPTKFMAPATRSEGKAFGTLVPMGARFQYIGPKSEIDRVIAASGLSAVGLDKVAKMYYYAAADYGIIIRDGTGNNGLNNYGDVTPEWGNVSKHPYWGDIFRKTTGLWKSEYWRVPARSAY